MQTLIRNVLLSAATATPPSGVEIDSVRLYQTRDGGTLKVSIGVYVRAIDHYGASASNIYRTASDVIVRDFVDTLIKEAMTAAHRAHGGGAQD